MSAATGLRLEAAPAVAARLAADPVLADRLRVTSGGGLFGSRVRRVPPDAVVVVAGSSGATTRAVLLRAAGLPVWWIDAFGSRCPGYGAPAVTSTWTDLPGLDRLAEAVARPGAGIAQGPPVSVVVTSLEEGHDLDRLVDQVVPQLGEHDELVLIDGGSRDGSVERVRHTWRDDRRVGVHVEAGAGISAGRNHGVRRARHDVVVCTDAGCDLAPGWVEGMRRAFATASPPGLVAGAYDVVGGGALGRAQALACYPDPHELARPDAVVRLHTRVFGSGFDPRFAVGRNVGFTRAAWLAADGFPEHLPTGEDVSFSLAVARDRRCVGTGDALVRWRQRPDLRATWRMYLGYGRASTDGGDRRLLARDGVRGAAWLAGALLLTRPRGRVVAAAGAAAYLSLPVRRAARARVAPGVYLLLPLAVATKDLGKLAGAVQGLHRRRARRRASAPAPRVAR